MSWTSLSDDGSEGGLDVRTTIRFWHEDQMYVRRQPQRSASIRNGIIDWTSSAEDSRILRGCGGQEAGWNDPDSTAIGSVSRVVGHETISTQGESSVTRRPREWSFVTLDHPTFDTGPGDGAFWTRVIKPLLDLEDARKDDVYGWLKLVFTFCEGKPFVYYSRYTPSARIHALAKAHKVRLQWAPLGHLSATLLARHRFWHQLWLSDSQWRALQARLTGRTESRPQAAHAIAVRHPRKP